MSQYQQAAHTIRQLPQSVARQMQRSNLTYRDAAAEIGISPSTLHSILVRCDEARAVESYLKVLAWLDREGPDKA